MDPDQAQDVIRCQYCDEEPAQFHCVPCGDELCPRCKTFHLKSKVPSGHNVIPISERLEPTNMIRMCEAHPSKPYDACCEDCQVPVCILCIQEIHNKHGIGKMQDMYEKQKAEAMKELSELQKQKRADAIQRIKDVENGELRIKTSHENIREEMKRQAKAFMEHINAILTDGLDESESDEKSKLEELSQHKVELEDYQRKVERVINKLENLTESSPLADLILYRKQNPDVVKQLKCPDTVVTTDPKFTVGQFNKIQNENQFGQLTKTKLSRMKADEMTTEKQMTRIENLLTQNLPVKVDGEKAQYESQKREETKMLMASAKRTFLHNTQSKEMARAENPTTRTLLQPVKLLHEIKPDKRELRHVTCVGDGRVYISGCGKIVIDKSRFHLRTITACKEPSDMAVMKDGSLIYSVRDDRAIYQMFPGKKERKIVDMQEEVLGLCCTRSGEMVCIICMNGFYLYNGLYSYNVMVVWYRGSDMIHEFVMSKEQYGIQREIHREWPICENVNGDICIGHRYTYGSNKNGVVVYRKTGNKRFYYDGRGGTREFHSFEPCALATDSLGHILVADNTYQVVHLISQAGDFAYILTKDDGISFPLSLDVDQFDNLWVIDRNIVKGHQHRDLVKVYQYLS